MNNKSKTKYPKTILSDNAPAKNFSEQQLEVNYSKTLNNSKKSQDQANKIKNVFISTDAPVVDISELKLNGNGLKTLDNPCINMLIVKPKREYNNSNKGYQKLPDSSLTPSTIRKSFNELVTLVENLPNIRKLPDNERYLAVHNILADLQNSFKIANEPPPLLKPDLSGNSYDIFPGVRVVKPYIWLKEHWGKWLKHFNDDLGQNLPYDFLYQDELNKLDPKLMKALKNQSNNIKKEHGFSTPEIIPPKKTRTDVMIQHCDQEKVREYYKVHSAINNRTR